jgi:hypothetical protein
MRILNPKFSTLKRRYIPIRTKIYQLEAAGDFGNRYFSNVCVQIDFKAGPVLHEETGLTPNSDSGRGATRVEDAQGTPTQSHISPSILVHEDHISIPTLHSGASLHGPEADIKAVRGNQQSRTWAVPGQPKQSKLDR